MTEQQIIEYMLASEKARYEAEKAVTKASRDKFIACVIGAIIGFCFYIYFNTPYKEIVVDGESKAVIESVVDNGSNVWQ